MRMGFTILPGRVKDYFKTIQGKFVAPTPIENIFSENPYTEQICLLGRGYSKTVMISVLSNIALEQPRQVVEAALLERVAAVNAEVDSHARIGAVIISSEPWSIDNRVLTPTMKIRREMVESLFGEKAQELALKSAETKKILVIWE
jgi:long-chain acyl-CoA synthetase